MQTSHIHSYRLYWDVLRANEPATQHTWDIPDFGALRLGGGAPVRATFMLPQNIDRKKPSRGFLCCVFQFQVLHMVCKALHRRATLEKLCNDTASHKKGETI